MKISERNPDKSKLDFESDSLKLFLCNTVCELINSLRIDELKAVLAENPGLSSFINDIHEFSQDQ